MSRHGHRNRSAAGSLSPRGRGSGRGLTLLVVDGPWRSQLLSLLDVARLGSQFPDAAKWRSLLELLGRDRAISVAGSHVSGLVAARSLGKLHRLQIVAREFFKTHKKAPLKEARAFSMALAALELPPLSHTHARLMKKDKVSRFVVTHERLTLNAVRFTLVLEQKSGSHIAMGKDHLAKCSEKFEAKLLETCEGSATQAHEALSGSSGLEVVEIVRGQLGPFVSGLWPGVEDAPADVRALRSVVKDAASAVLSVQLERLGADVAKTSLQDPWAGAEPPVKGKQLARERRLFCTPELEEAVKALVRPTGKAVLVRCK